MATDLDRTFGWLPGDGRLTEAERRVVADAAAGGTTVFADTGEVAAREVRGVVIRRLFSGLEAGWTLTVLGLRLTGARILDGVDLGGLCATGGGHLPFLELSKCDIDGPLRLTAARLEAVRLDGSRLGRLEADDVDIARGLSARDAAMEDGGADFSGAVLGADLVLSGARLRRTDKPALLLLGARIRHVELNGLVAVGGVAAAAIKVTIQISANGARLEAPGATALDLDGAEVDAVFLKDARLFGLLRMNACAIRREFNACRALLDGGDGFGMMLNAATLLDLYLVGTSVRGGLQAIGARIGGVFDGSGASFANPGGEALDLRGSRIDGGLILQDVWSQDGEHPLDRPTRIDGQLDLGRARIGADLALEGLILTAAREGRPAGVAVDGRGLEVAGAVWWTVSEAGRRPRVEGVVNLSGACLEGDVDLRGLAIDHRLAALAQPPDPRGTLSRFRLETTALALAGAEIGGRLLIGVAPARARAPAAPTQDAPADPTGRAWAEPTSDVETTACTDFRGRLHLARARIARDTRLDQLVLRPPEAPGPAADEPVLLCLEGAVLESDLYVRLRDGAAAPGAAGGIADLGGARCRGLDDGPAGAGWGAPPTVSAAGAPVGVRLRLDGLTYDGLTDQDDPAASAWASHLPEWLLPRLDPRRWPLWARRAAWLRRQDRGRRPSAPNYAPQPWTQLGEALAADGRDEDARKIAIAHYNFRLAAGVEPWFQAARSWAVRLLFAYGYSPALSLAWLAVFVGLGAAAMTAALAEDARGRLAAPAPCERTGPWRANPACPVLVKAAGDESEAEKTARRETTCVRSIDPLLYAIDVFLPVINLKEQDRCEINPERPAWRLAKTAYAILGWVFTPLAALTFAGVLKRK